MKRYRTVARWLSEVLPTSENERKAREADRRMDKRVGAMMKSATPKTPETDWRRLLKKGDSHE